jgi:hypothetical protein
VKVKIQWLAVLSIFTSLILGIWVMLQAFLEANIDPFRQQNIYWASTYAVLFLITGLTFRIWKGRLLLIIEIFAICALILVPAISANLALPLLIFATWIFVVFVVGDWLINSITSSKSQITSLSFLERLCMGVTFGLGIFMLISLLMATLGLFTRPVAVSVLVVFIFIAFWRLREILKWTSVRQTISSFTNTFVDPSGNLPKVTLLIGIILILVIGSYLWALAPAVRFDALMYQLAAPERYVNAGRMIPIPESMNTTYAHYANLLFGFGLLLFGQPLPGLLHFTMGLLTAGFTYILGQRLFSHRVGTLAAILLLSLPWFSKEIGTAYIDAFISAYLGAMFFASFLWWQASVPLWLSGIFAGLALGIKLTALPAILSLTILLSIAILYKNRFIISSLSQTLRIVVMIGLPALLLFLPWIVRDWHWSGTPLYPWQAEWLFQRSDLPISVRATQSIIAPNFLQRVLSYPWTLLVNSRVYHESPGGANAALPFLGLPWYFAFYPFFSKTHRQNGLYIFLQLFMTSVFCLALFSILVRYNLPSFIFLSIGAALNLECLALHWKNINFLEPKQSPLHTQSPWFSVSDSSHKPHWMINLGIASILFYLFITRLAGLLPLMVYDERYPVNLLLGNQTTDQFLTDNLPIYPVFKFINSIPNGPHKILSIGNEFRLYTTAHIHASEDRDHSYSLLHQPTYDEHLAEALNQRGFQFLLIDEHEIAARPYLYKDLIPTETFLKNYTRLVFILPGIRLYQLYPLGTQRSPITNLLSNPDFEDFPVDGLPPAWTPFGVVALETSSTHVYNGAVSLRLHGELPPEAYGYVHQTIPVTGNEIYTMGYWAKPTADTKMTLQIHWLDKNLRKIRQDAQWPIADLDWNWYSMTVMAPSNAHYAQVFLACNGTVEVWFDQICFAHGEWCWLP